MKEELILCVLVSIVSCIVTYVTVSTIWQGDAVKHGMAHYKVSDYGNQEFMWNAAPYTWYTNTDNVKK